MYRFIVKKLVIFFTLFSVLLSVSTIDSGQVWAGEGEMKRAVMLIAQDKFRDEELFEPRKILEKSGIEVKIASTTLGEVSGMLGGKVKPDILLRDIKSEDFDAIILVGGQGASQYWDDDLAHKLIKEANQSQRIVAAICIAPVTLARAGILKNKRSTVWESESGQLESQGAVYTAKAVERDGNIITASGPTAAAKFAEEIVKALGNK